LIAYPILFRRQLNRPVNPPAKSNKLDGSGTPDETGPGTVPLFKVPFAVPDQSTVPTGAVESITKVSEVKGTLTPKFTKVRVGNKLCTKVTLLEVKDCTVKKISRSPVREAPVTPERPVKVMVSF
jgi:hypothetical protein